MSAPNPLVAPPTESTALQGTFVLEGLEGMVMGLQNESWVETSVSGFTTALDAAALVSDPIQQLVAMGVGWALEHIQPLKGWLNDLTGDAGAVAGFAATWGNIQTQLDQSAGDLEIRYSADVADQSGVAMNTYRATQGQNVDALRQIAGAAGATGMALQGCSFIVQMVHDIVRDAISQVVGFLVDVGWKALFVVTIPAITVDVIQLVANLASSIGKRVTGTIASARNLGDLIGSLGDLIRQLPDLLRGARPDPPGVAPASSAVPPVPPVRPDVETPTPRPDDPDAPGTRPADGQYPTGRLPETGEPNSFGYDANGDRMPYANSRPSYGPDQVEDVWNSAKNADGEVWVEGPDGAPLQIEWQPGEPRRGVWDMGHVPGEEYRHLRNQYLNHEISYDEFMRRYREAGSYQVEDPTVNRSRRNEAP